MGLPELNPEEIAKSQYELKKVQQRTIALLIFAVIYQCSFVLIGYSRTLIESGRTGDAYLLIALGYVLALGQTFIIRGLLGHRPFSVFWTAATLVPLIVFQIWYF